MLKKSILFLIGFYRRYVSRFIAPRCRYYPSCSLYGKQALMWHSTPKGLWLISCRIASCHPWGGSGIDFVPLPLYRYTYQPCSVLVHRVYQDNSSYVARLRFLMRWSNQSTCLSDGY